ncbi:MAG: redoxin [Planctomycetes bacterium]|nr:redoxin [Planctomycetota bacterium]
MQQPSLCLSKSLIGTAVLQLVFAGLALARAPQGVTARVPSAKWAPRVLQPSEHGVGRRVAMASVRSLAGVEVELPGEAKYVVFALLSPTCPLSAKFTPTLVELAQAAPAGVRWVIVDPVATDTRESLQALAERFGASATVVSDAEGRLARALGATTTTDVIVTDAAFTVQFHGAVDDQHGIGYSLEKPRRRFLLDALSALVRSEPLLVAATDAPGCELELGDSPAPTTEVTYHERVERIIQQRCVECHRDGGVAPFSLERFEDVVAHAGMLRRVVEKGVMPPWFAAPFERAEGEAATTPWANDRSLGERERADLLAWLASGKPKGDPTTAPLPRQFAGEWNIPTPDRVFQFAEPVAVKASGTMPYQNVIVETGLEEDRWVRAMEVRPGVAGVVHHVLVHLVDPELERANEGRRRRRADDDIAAEERLGFWAAYVPGQAALCYPPGFAKLLPKGAKLRFQMHYTPNGTATEDRTRIGVVYADAPPLHEVRTIGVVNPRIRIPPGAADHEESATFPIPLDAVLLSFVPHLHVRGKAARYERIARDGASSILLDVPRYDFNWQLLYRLAEPVTLRAGEQLRFTAWYDNSAGNPANPDPAATVRWGPQTFDEMHLGYVEYYLPWVPPGAKLPVPRRGR